MTTPSTSAAQDTKRAALYTVEPSGLSRWLPILMWLPQYSREQLSSDALAAVIVTIMLIPQSLAYAMLAGLPPEMGLYASILPLVAYAIFGTSRTLAVGPVAVVSLMTAASVGELAAQGTADYAGLAIALAFLSGVMLIILGIFRLGFLANFLSHPVIAGFITASAILIAASQLKHILGVPMTGDNLWEMLASLSGAIGRTHVITLAIGTAATAFLFWVRARFKPLLLRLGFAARPADMISKAGPVAAIAVTSILAWAYNLGDAGVRLVGSIPQGLPPLTWPAVDAALWSQLVVPALLISLVGFVESISVAQTLAAKRRQRIVPDQELIGLGASNIAAAVTGGFPVTGGFARSVVNFDAGAETPAAGAFTAIGILLASVMLTPLLFFLPQATLAATIIVAVLSLIDLSIIRRTFAYAKSDFAAMLATIVGTLSFGVEIGIMTGVGLSLVLLLYRSSHPHFAVVGQVPGTEHYRNVLRHAVLTYEKILSLRIDESLTFVNARFLEDTVYDSVAANPALEHVILMCPAINHIDASALESLEAINHRLKDAGVTLHLSEVKGPVMDRLKPTHFMKDLTGNVYLSQHQACSELAAT